MAQRNTSYTYPNEVDQLEVFRSITKRLFGISFSEQASQIVSKSFNISLSGRPGSVCIELPADMFDSAVDEYDYSRLAPSDDNVKSALKMLGEL